MAEDYQNANEPSKKPLIDLNVIRKRQKKILADMENCPDWRREKKGHISSYDSGSVKYTMEAGKVITVKENIASNTGSKVWDCNFVMGKYFELNPSIVDGKSVIELGAGLGLLSIIIAELGASKVVCTDVSEMMKAMSENISDNDASVEAKEFNFANQDHVNFFSEYDLSVVVGCNLFFSHHLLRLVSQLCQTLLKKSMVAYFGDDDKRVPRADTRRAFEDLGFEVKEVPIQSFHEDFRCAETYVLEVRTKDAI